MGGGYHGGFGDTSGNQEFKMKLSLSTMPEGKCDLYASYYTDDDCDSTLILHLTVVEEQNLTAIPDVPQKGNQRVQKTIWNGRLVIIREDETIYDVLGTKIK